MSYSGCSAPEGKNLWEALWCGFVTAILYISVVELHWGASPDSAVVFHPIVLWYSGWSMRQKATLVHDSTRKFLLDRMTQEPDICFKGKQISQEETKAVETVQWSGPNLRGKKSLTAGVKVDTTHTLFFSNTLPLTHAVAQHSHLRAAGTSSVIFFKIISVSLNTCSVYRYSPSLSVSVNLIFTSQWYSLYQPADK